jgi:hypothetical protein
MSLSTFSAVHVEAGQIRRLWFQAAGEPEARELCVKLGLGYDGPSSGPETHTTPSPEAYDEKTTRQLLGGVSRSFLYRELVAGRLERVPNTRRLLITRSSIESWTRN